MRKDHAMHLQAGQPAPLFESADLYGTPIALSHFRGRHTLLAFFRSASCPLSGARLSYLIQHHPQLQAQGLTVLAIFESSYACTLQYAARQHPAFPLVIDPRKSLYRLYGVEAAPLRLPFGMLRRIPQYWYAWRHHVGGRVTDGDKSLLPADFLIGPDLRIAQAYYGRDIGDHISARMIGTFLEGTPSLAPTAPFQRSR
jgi:peroxiredoxin Q/BCP